MVNSVLVCIVTRNKAIMTTTLHSTMTLNMLCMSKNINLEVQFHNDKSTLPKAMKTSCDRLIWIDYGVAVDSTILETIVSDFPDNYKVLVVPCVTENVDWEAFKKKTLSDTEPVYQRALKFDTDCSKVIKNGVSEFISSTSDGRLIAMDTKAVMKRIRDQDTTYKSLEQIKKLGVKIGVLRTGTATCHYVYECIGNIIESSGVRVGP